MKTYEKPAVVDHGDLKSITEAALTGEFYDCNARPGFPINPLDQGSIQNPVC